EVLVEREERKHAVTPRAQAAHDRAVSEEKEAENAQPDGAVGAEDLRMNGRGIPRWVERVVKTRDDNRCQWRKPNGEICGSKWKVEVDHVIPVGMGGRSTVENCRCACRAH